MQTAPGVFRLVLTGINTGEANAFTVTSNLTGGTGVAFGANAVEAADAELTVNSLPVSSTSNTLENVIPGATVTRTGRIPPPPSPSTSPRIPRR